MKLNYENIFGYLEVTENNWLLLQAIHVNYRYSKQHCLAK